MDIFDQIAKAEALSQAVYQWCTQEARNLPSARALAAIYVGMHLGGRSLLVVEDLKSLDSERTAWAASMLQGYVEGWFKTSNEYALTLCTLYDLFARAAHHNEPQQWPENFSALIH